MKKTTLALLIFALLSISCKGNEPLPNPITFADREGIYANSPGNAGANHRLTLMNGIAKAVTDADGVNDEEVFYDPLAFAPANRDVLNFPSYIMVFRTDGDVEYTTGAGRTIVLFKIS